MSGQNPNVGTYCPGVRVGNWFEDIALEENILKDYLDKRERGDLLCQKKTSIGDLVDRKVDLSVSRDGNVHFGDIVMIVNPQPDDQSRGCFCLCMTLDEDTIYHVQERLCAETKQAVASKNIQAGFRSAFVIRSCDGSHDGEPVRYNQPFYLCTADGKHLLLSDAKTFNLYAKMSRHNKVWFGSEPSHLAEWQILPIPKDYRMEMEYSPVPANTKILFNHVKTNQRLCLENELCISTYFGRETEVSCHTAFGGRRSEFNTNYWMLLLHAPGDEVLGVQAPVTDDAECPRNCQKPCVDVNSTESS